jgi:hypothetical protein
VAQAVTDLGSGAVGTWLKTLHGIGLIACIGAIAIVVEGMARVWRGPGGWLVRTSEAALALLALLGLWVIQYLGLASFSGAY